MQPVPYRPRIESLEERAVPALLLNYDASGNLTSIFGNGDSEVGLVVVGNDVLRVEENGGSLGTYNVAGNLSVTVGNSVVPLTHNFTFENGSFLSGNVTLSFGNNTADTNVLLNGSGMIGGNLFIRTGNTSATFTVNDQTGVDVGGSLTIQGGLGQQVVVLGPGTVIGGNLQVNNATTLSLVDTRVGGIFVTNSSFQGLPVMINTGASMIAGSAVITTGSGNDVLAIDGLIAGNAFIQMGDGENQLAFGAALPSTVLGFVSVQGGNGGDFINFGGMAPAIFGSTVIVNVRDGAPVNGNFVNFNNATVLGTAMTFVGGNGADYLSVMGLRAPGARLSVSMGNGNDVVLINAATSALFAAQLDGGFGVNLFGVPAGRITFPLTIRRFFGAP